MVDRFLPAMRTILGIVGPVPLAPGPEASEPERKRWPMHAHHTGRDPRSSRGKVTTVATILAPLLLVTVIGILALWPSSSAMPEKLPTIDPEAVWITAVVTGTPDLETSTVPARVTAVPADSRARLEKAGADPIAVGTQVIVNVGSEQITAGMQVGAPMRVVFLPYATDDGGPQSPYVFVDYERQAPIAVLAIIYGLLVVVVARWRGLAAFAGLGMAVVVLGWFTLPALLTAENPFLVALLSAVAIMFVALYLAHGITVRTSAALLGTIAGLAITAGVGAWAARAAELNGLTSEEALTLPAYAPGLDLHGIVLCGIVLAGLGVLNDVTITQASAVWELRAAAPGATRRQLVTGALRIGRDHIASTVYTIVFAYLGASLPLFMLIVLQEQSLGTSLTSGAIAEEVVRTLVSSIGLVLAIPITTVIAALLAPPAGVEPGASRAAGRHTAGPPADAPATLPGSLDGMLRAEAGLGQGDRAAPDPER